MTYKKLLYSLDGITLNILTLVNGVLQEVTDLSLNVPILESGLIPARYLPSYVDDIIEGYYYNNAFYKDSAHTQLITGETGKIYVDLSTDLTYRWSGSAYVEVSKAIITGVKGGAESNYRTGNVNITAANIGLANVANIDLSKAIKTITRSGTTFTYTCLDGTTGTFTQLDENTWRPLGTGANDACAGNDSRLSNSRPASDVYAWAKAATKPSYSWSEITSKPTAVTGTCSLKQAISGNIVKYYYYCPMTQADAKKVISIFFCDSLGDIQVPGYNSTLSYGNITLTNCWSINRLSVNIGPVTYRYLIYL